MVPGCDVVGWSAPPAGVACKGGTSTQGIGQPCFPAVSSQPATWVRPHVPLVTSCCLRGGSAGHCRAVTASLSSPRARPRGEQSSSGQREDLPTSLARPRGRWVCSTTTGQAMWCFALDWSGEPGCSFPFPSLRSRARPRNRSRMPGLLQAGALRAAPGARPPWTTAGGTRGTNCALQDVSIPSRPPAVGSHACGERPRALRIAGTRRAGFSLSSGRVLSLSLTISRDIVVDFIPYITKSRRKTRDEHGHTRVPRNRLTRNGHTDNQVLGTMCDLKSRLRS